MANAKEVVIDTYVPRVDGFATRVADATTEPFKMTTAAGAVRVAGRLRSLPTLSYTYAANRDTYDDIIYVSQEIGTGDGSTTVFNATLASANPPIIFNTLQITDGTQMITDVSEDLLADTDANFSETYTGTGRLQIDGAGTIVYETGALAATFTQAPAAGTRILASWLTVLHTPMALGSIPPDRADLSTRLQKITTDDSSITLVTPMATTDWDRLRNVTGRAIQSREANESISILEDRHSQMGNSFFNDGDLVEGCEVAVSGAAVDPATNTTRTAVTVTPGRIWIAGAVRNVPEANLFIDGKGEESIGLRVIASDITENQDSNLKNPATGFDGTGLPGAYRQRVYLQWRTSDIELDAVVFRFVDGVLLNKELSTFYSDVNEVLARRTYNESGHYRVRGFTGSFQDRTDSNGNLDDFNLTLSVDGGLAYVKGFEVYRPALQPLVWKKAQDTFQTVDGFQYKPTTAPTDELYKLQRRPVASVAKLSGIARTPRMKITRQNGTSTDILPSVSIEDAPPNRPGQIYSAIPNVSATARLKLYDNNLAADGSAVDYTEGVDFLLDSSGDSITWQGGNQPAGGGTYWGFWNYDTDNGQYPLVKGTRVYAETTNVFTVANASADDTQSLSLGDVQGIVSVVNDADGTTYRKGHDYTLDSGRTATNSDPANVGSVTFIAPVNGGSIADGASVTVKFGYWQHSIALWDTSHDDSAEGDYLGVDSYLEESTSGSLTFAANPGTLYRVPFEKLNDEARRDANASNTDTSYIDAVIDWIDLRPKGLGNSQSIGARQLAVDDSGNGIGTTNATYKFYLDRMDTVTLDKEGRVTIVYGSSGSNPRRPVISGDVLRILDISSLANSRSPQVGLSTITRTTMEELQLVKRRMEDLEVQVATSALENDAQQNADTFAIRGIFTDPLNNFNHMDLDYDRNVVDPEPTVTWGTATQYNLGQTVGDVATPVIYARCIKSGLSSDTTNPFTSKDIGDIVDEAVENPGENGTAVWRVYAKPDTPGGLVTNRVFHDVAIDSLIGAMRFPMIHTEPDDDLRDYIKTADSEFYQGDQIALLQYQHIVEINQPYATETELVNPYSTFEPVMNVTLDPAADFWVETRHGADLVIPLPGSTVVNLSVGYDGARADPDSPGKKIVGQPLPQVYPIGRLYNWDNRFQVGVPVEFLGLGMDYLPGIQVVITKQGREAIIIDPELEIGHGGWGNALVAQEIRMSQRTMTQRIGNVIVDTGLLAYTRQKWVKVTGELFPILSDVSCTFAGRDVSSTFRIRSGGAGSAGGVSGTVRPESDPNSNNYGMFEAEFYIPSGVPLGNHLVECTSNNRTRSATYVAHGTFEVIAQQYTSVTTTVYDVVGALCPVSQSFIPTRSGYVSRIDLWFYTKDTTKGIEVQLRNMVNGYPGTVVLGKRTLSPSQIKISNNASNNKRTEVWFKDPVWVDAGTEYCFTILDDSDQYRVWTARIGHDDVLTGVKVIKQKELGVFFKSANNTTWTADQYVDMKFKLYYATPTSQTGTIVFNQIDDMVATHLLLASTQFIPPGDPPGSIDWTISLDGGANYVPIAPSQKLRINSVVRTVDLRCTMTAATDPVDGRLLSPAINLGHMGIAASVFTGSKVASGLHAGLVEANYISDNIGLTTNGFEELKTVIHEYTPIDENDNSTTSVYQYYSLDDGATWVQFPNSTAEAQDGIDSYASVQLGPARRHIDERTRSVTFNPITALGAHINLAAGTGDGGTLADGAYRVRYALKTQYGQSAANTSGSATVSGSNNGKIEFDMPSSTAWPEDPGYNVDKPVVVTGIRVYMSAAGGAAGTEKELADTAWEIVSAPLGAGDTIRIKTAAWKVPDSIPSNSDSSIPLQFRTRTQLLAPAQGDIILGPTAEISGITFETTGGSIPNGNGTDNNRYSLVLCWTNTRWDQATGVTTPSPSHDTTDDLQPSNSGAGTNTMVIPTASVVFPPQAVGVRFFIKPLAGGSATELWVTDVEVVRDGSTITTDTVLPTDTGPYRIKNIPATGAVPPTENSTGKVTATAPQVAKYRVIAHDEAL